MPRVRYAGSLWAHHVQPQGGVRAHGMRAVSDIEDELRLYQHRVAGTGRGGQSNF